MSVLLHALQAGRLTLPQLKRAIATKLQRHQMKPQKNPERMHEAAQDVHRLQRTA